MLQKLKRNCVIDCFVGPLLSLSNSLECLTTFEDLPIIFIVINRGRAHIILICFRIFETVVKLVCRS
jgi:hypothetical protein